MMRLFAGLALLVLLAGPARAAEIRVAIGIDDTPQDSLAVVPGQDSGGTAPLKEELAREICRRIHAHCWIVPLHVGEILPAIEAKRIDLGFGMFLRTPERERRFLFSDPVWQATSRLLATTATVSAWTARAGTEPGLAGLQEARVVAVAGSAQHAALAARAEQQKLSVAGARTLAETIATVGDGQADFALVPVFSAYTLLRHETSPRLAFSGPPLTGEDLGGSARIALPLQAGELLGKVNSALVTMREDGSWQRIMRRHLPIGLY